MSSFASGEERRKRLYGGALSGIDGSSWAIETVWLLCLLLIIMISVTGRRTVSTPRVKEVVFWLSYTKTSVATVFWVRYCGHILENQSFAFWFYTLWTILRVTCLKFAATFSRGSIFSSHTNAKLAVFHVKFCQPRIQKYAFQLFHLVCCINSAGLLHK